VICGERPRAIESNFDKYGPIGMVFALLTWLVAFALVMLGCPLVGHIIYHARRPDAGATPAAPSEQISSSPADCGRGDSSPERRSSVEDA
jgi:hypothetical protein